MGFDHKTSEAFAPKNTDTLGKDNVVEFERIFAVQGTNFQQRFLGEAIMPVRQDVAIMALQQLIAKAMPQTIENEPEVLVRRAFHIADMFCLLTAPTLDARLKDYFDLYLKRGSIDDIMKSQMENAHDYSL